MSFLEKRSVSDIVKIAVLEERIEGYKKEIEARIREKDLWIDRGTKYSNHAIECENRTKHLQDLFADIVKKNGETILLKDMNSKLLETIKEKKC